MRASDKERFYQCVTCELVETCNLDESAENERGLCKEYRKDEIIVKNIAKWFLRQRGARE